MNKPVCLGPSVLELRKTLIYEIWCDYIKPKCAEKKLSYMNTDLVYIKATDIYIDIAC